MVERVTAAEVRRQWARAGSPPCQHPKLSPEHDAGTPTGRLVCRRCGFSAPSVVAPPAAAARRFEPV